MRRAIVFALVWITLGFTSPGQTLVRVGPENGRVATGATVCIEVRAENVGGLHLAHLYLGYDSTVVRFVGAAIGTFMAGAFFHQSKVVRNGSASLLLDAALLGRVASASGSGTICSVQFSGIKEGPSRLTCDELRLLDTSNSILPCRVVEGMITVERSNAATDPGTCDRETVFLAQNYPNPVNSTTTIEYRLARQGTAKFELFDILGRRVAGFDMQRQSMGKHRIQFDVSGLPSGEYFYLIWTDDPGGSSGSGISGARRLIVLR